MSNNKNKLITKIKKELPQKPGVYLFYDINDAIIYIGKSVNLRQRVLSYFRANLSGLENRIKLMIFNIHDFSYYETETELLALLLEDKLIKQNLPYFNIRQQEFREYQYLLLTKDTFPCLKILNFSTDFENNKVFGPFKDRYFTQNILNIIYQIFHLRSCYESEPAKKCMNFEIQLCSGPCRQKISPANYTEIVKNVIGFLDGNEILVVKELTTTMKKHAAALEFETARQIKEKIQFCKNFCKRQRFIQKFRSQKLVISGNGKTDLTYIFQKGFYKTAEKDQFNSSSSNQDDRFLLDRANIVYNWLHKNKNICEYYFE